MNLIVWLICPKCGKHQTPGVEVGIEPGQVETCDRCGHLWIPIPEEKKK